MSCSNSRFGFLLTSQEYEQPASFFNGFSHLVSPAGALPAPVEAEQRTADMHKTKVSNYNIFMLINYTARMIEHNLGLIKAKLLLFA